MRRLDLIGPTCAITRRRAGGRDLRRTWYGRDTGSRSRRAGAGRPGPVRRPVRSRRAARRDWSVLDRTDWGDSVRKQSKLVFRASGTRSTGTPPTRGVRRARVRAAIMAPQTATAKRCRRTSASGSGGMAQPAETALRRSPRIRRSRGGRVLASAWDGTRTTGYGSCRIPSRGQGYGAPTWLRALAGTPVPGRRVSTARRRGPCGWAMGRSYGVWRSTGNGSGSARPKATRRRSSWTSGRADIQLISVARATGFPNPSRYGSGGPSRTASAGNTMTPGPDSRSSRARSPPGWSPAGLQIAGTARRRAAARTPTRSLADHRRDDHGSRRRDRTTARAPRLRGGGRRRRPDRLVGDRVEPLAPDDEAERWVLGRLTPREGRIRVRVNSQRRLRRLMRTLAGIGVEPKVSEEKQAEPSLTSPGDRCRTTMTTAPAMAMARTRERGKQTGWTRRWPR